MTPELSGIVAEEHTSIVNRKDNLQGEPTQESICQNPELLGGAEGEEQKGSKISAGRASVKAIEEYPRNWRGSHGGPTSSVSDVF